MQCQCWLFGLLNVLLISTKQLMHENLQIWGAWSTSILTILFYLQLLTNHLTRLLNIMNHQSHSSDQNSLSHDALQRFASSSYFGNIWVFTGTLDCLAPSPYLPPLPRCTGCTVLRSPGLVIAHLGKLPPAPAAQLSTISLVTARPASCVNWSPPVPGFVCWDMLLIGMDSILFHNCFPANL